MKTSKNLDKFFKDIKDADIISNKKIDGIFAIGATKADIGVVCNLYVDGAVGVWMDAIVDRCYEDESLKAIFIAIADRIRTVEKLEHNTQNEYLN